MKTYKYNQDGNVMQFDEDGLCRVSGLRSAFPDDITIEPADPVPNPRISEIDSILATIDLKSIRALREGNTSRIAELELQATLLRTERAYKAK